MLGQTANAADKRIDWVDYAKGICIILVVMMHSTLGVEAALGEVSWLNAFIEWARPFRMPDFFLISGLFLATRINRPWRDYLDTKFVHFAYFYILWMTIQFSLKGPGMVAESGAGNAAIFYLQGFVQPYGTLWFIYLLGVFFVVTKLLQRVPVIAVWLGAALLESANIHTGWMVADEFASRFIYFYSGYILAPHVFAVAQRFSALGLAALLSGLGVWAVINGYLVTGGYAVLPGMSLALGFIGTSALIALSVLLTRAKFMDWLRYCGEHSIVIYLSFFVFMAASRVVLLKLGFIADAGVISLIVTAAGVLGPVLLFFAVRRTPLKFLFERPAMFRLTSTTTTGSAKVYPAE